MALVNKLQRGAAPQKRTAVLHLTADLALHAMGREVVDLAIQTHRCGWRPLVASAGGSLVLEAERAAVRHTQLPLGTTSSYQSWRNRVHLEKLIERERPVLIHAHGFEVLGTALKLMTRRHLPLLVDLTEPVVINKSTTKLLHLAAARGAFFRVPSLFMLNHLREDFKVQTDHLYHIRPGVDLQWFDPSRVSPERIHALSNLWRLPEQATLIIMATPFAPGFGHQMLLEALHDLKDTDLCAVLIGQDKQHPGMRAKLERQVTACGLEGRVVMPENCMDWPAACWLSSAVLALNAMARGQAPEILAAQAIGRPVLVSCCGANAELIEENKTGWLLPIEDKNALIKALRDVLAMGLHRRIDVAECTRAFMEEMFPMESWRDSLFALYDRMLRTDAPRQKTKRSAA
ncbi:MAG: glycosyltransferase [Alphaproteobacteria bacterium]|nr:glycosyltransferase [Alphaproteobacteria bacterium]